MLHFIKKITSIHAIHISNFKKLNYTSGFFFKHLLDFAIKPVIHCNLSKKKKKKIDGKSISLLVALLESSC